MVSWRGPLTRWQSRNSRNQGSELSNATIVPQSNVVADVTHTPSPHMVTCEVSRVCWLKLRQHNTQHMQITRRGQKLVKSRTRP